MSRGTTGSQPFPAPVPGRPRFAIALGSGGVRSIAALGMVQVLMAHGLQPDLVVGCSAGAMFGALIAAGHGADEAVRIATTLWSAEVTTQRRWLALPQMLWPRLGRFNADFAMRNDHRVMERLAQAFGGLQFSDLALPLRVATTCAATGERVVLHSGSLVQALRASIALPFMFAPVVVNGRRLVDGCLADPLPVSAAADAQAVLALGFPAPMPRQIDGPSRLLAQVSSSLTNNLMQARLAEARRCCSAGWACSTPRPCRRWWTPGGVPPRQPCPTSWRCCGVPCRWRRPESPQALGGPPARRRQLAAGMRTCGRACRRRPTPHSASIAPATSGRAPGSGTVTTSRPVSV